MLRFKKPDGTEYSNLSFEPLGSYCYKISSGKTKKSTDEGEYVLYGSTGPIGRTDNAEYDGTYVLVARVGANAGTVNCRRGTFGVSDNTLVIENKESLLPEYLYSQLQAYNLNRLIFGSGQPLITGGQLKQLVLGFPPIEEQQKIANCLSSVDAVISDYEAQVENMQNQKKGAVQKLFSQEVRFKADDGSEYPKWRTLLFNEIADLHARIGWQNLRKEEFLDEGDYYLFTGTDFDKGTINLQTCHYIDKERYDQDSNIQVCEGTILITKDGTLGKVAMVPKLDKPATLNAGVFAVQNVISDVYNKYLYQYLAAPFLLKYAAETSTGGTIKHLNQGVLVDFPIPVPAIEEQQKIADCLSAFDAAIEDLQKTAEHWKNIKKGLLQQLFA